jgi:hypothetical protein
MQSHGAYRATMNIFFFFFFLTQFKPALGNGIGGRVVDSLKFQTMLRGKVERA